MKQDRKRSSKRKVQAVAARTVQLPLPVLGVLLDARSAFFELCIETGRSVLMAMQEADREILCGEKGRHDLQRRAVRGGSTPSRVTLGGRAIAVPRLRARGEAGELGLPSFLWAADRDPLDNHTLAVIGAGVSTRRYRRTLDTLPTGVQETSTSKSAVSRRFVTLSRRRMVEFLARPLPELDLRIIFIDGKVFKQHTLLIALGVDSDGKKHVLGVREGATENARVVTSLLADLVDRGLSTDRPILFVIDGAKALRKAIRDVFGNAALVQRCQVHKRRNVLDHLPAQLRPSVHRALDDAYQSDSASLAKRQLERLAHSLDHDHPGAAASLREGLEETVTVQALGIVGALRRTLATTNPIENLNGSVAGYCHNVKRWRGGLMIQRWVTAALVDAEQQFRRVRGFRDLPRLIAALDNRITEVPGAAMVA
jgi:transposase-like protein